MKTALLFLAMILVSPPSSNGRAHDTTLLLTYHISRMEAIYEDFKANPFETGAEVRENVRDFAVESRQFDATIDTLSETEREEARSLTAKKDLLVIKAYLLRQKIQETNEWFYLVPHKPEFSYEKALAEDIQWILYDIRVIDTYFVAGENEHGNINIKLVIENVVERKTKLKFQLRREKDSQRRFKHRVGNANREIASAISFFENAFQLVHRALKGSQGYEGHPAYSTIKKFFDEQLVGRTPEYVKIEYRAKAYAFSYEWKVVTCSFYEKE